MDTTEILNQIETEKLIAFKEDKIMFEAVKKYLLAYLYDQGVIRPDKSPKSNINWALQLAWDRNGVPRSDQELGQDLRAVTRGIQIIESGFIEMEQISKPKDEEETPTNPAE